MISCSQRCEKAKRMSDDSAYKYTKWPKLCGHTNKPMCFCFLKNVVTDPHFDLLNSFQSFAKAWCWTIKWICRDSLSFRRESISKVTLMLTDGGSESIYSKSVEPTSRAPLWNLNDKWDTMPTSWTRVKYAIWDRVEAQARLKYPNLLMRRVSTYFGHVVY